MIQGTSQQEHDQMADQQQLERLTRSVDEWNEWRQQAYFEPDLIVADLSGVDLSGANLNGATLGETSLINARLINTSLSMANLTRANFNGATLSGADLNSANLTQTNLRGASLDNAILCGATLCGTYLSGTYLTNTRFWATVFLYVDLSAVKELDTANHQGRSSVDINSVILPRDEAIRKHFLRGVGFTETQIEYLPSLLIPRSIQYCSLFISYAHQDETVAKRLYTDLHKKDVPCWFAPHDLRPGTPLLRGIEEAIHVQDKFLLILSKHAVNSAWVEREVDAALHQEIKRGKDVLFPIRLDNAVLESRAGWARRLQHRHIGDFTNWQEDRAYQEAFSTLLRHLKVNGSPMK